MENVKIKKGNEIKSPPLTSECKQIKIYYTVIISFSLASANLSTLIIKLSVIF